MENLKFDHMQNASEQSMKEKENFDNWHNWLKTQNLSYHSFAFLVSRFKVKTKNISGESVDFSFLRFKRGSYPTRECEKMLENSASKYCWEETVKKILLSGWFGFCLYAIDNTESAEALGIFMSLIGFLFLTIIEGEKSFSKPQIYHIAQSHSQNESLLLNL